MVRIVIKNAAVFEGERIADVANPERASSPAKLKALWGLCWSRR